MKKRSLLIMAGAALLTLVSCGNQNAGNNNDDTMIVIGEKQQQLDFEQQYIDASFSYAEGGKFAMSMISNIATICAGVGFDSPTTIVSGVFGLLTSINDNLNGSNGPTIKDVMNKLNEMDTKLDAINDKLDQNYNQLMTESIRTQAMVDKVLLDDMENAIWDFNTNYVEPLQDYTRNFSDYLEQSYKEYIKKDETSDFFIHKNEKNEWVLDSLMDGATADSVEVTVSINDFTGSKTFLEKNYDCVTKGFMDRFNEDIDKAVDTALLPAGLDKTMARNFISGNLVEQFTKQYAVDNHDKVLELRNQAINYAKQISGKSTKSIADRYVGRLQYMFNFAGEMKDHVTDAFANLMYNLNNNVTFAAQSCVYAGISQEELRSEFINAHDVIKTYYENIKKVNDNYCFLTNTNVGSGFYRAMWNTYYTDKGNHCVFHSTFKFDKVTTSYLNRFQADDVNAHYFLNEVDHTRIVMRWNLMRELGLDASGNYMSYLRSAKIVSQSTYQAYQDLIDMKWISSDAFRFFTGLNTRGMNDGDRSQGMTCNEAGNPGGDYFNVGNRYNFRDGHDSGCWSGTIAETTYIDGNSGTIQSNKTVAAFATYAESHWNWIDDEYWSFVDNPAGNYFFTLESIVNQ